MSPKKRPQRRRSAPPARSLPDAPDVVPVAGQLAFREGRGTGLDVAHLGRLRELRQRREELDEHLAAAVAAAHADGVPYAAIGRALGITRQSARAAVLRRLVAS